MRISDSGNGAYLQQMARSQSMTDVSPEERRQLLTGKRPPARDGQNDAHYRTANSSAITRSWLA